MLAWTKPGPSPAVMPASFPLRISARISLGWRVSIGMSSSDLYVLRRAPHINKVEEGQPTGREAELCQHHGGLASVLGGVLGLMDHLLPQRIRPRVSLGGGVFDDLGE